MKNIKILLLSVMVMLCGSNVNAQSIKVYKTDGTAITVPYSELESIIAVEDEGEESKYEFVDLGLSVKWATCNVGAEKPEDFGDYFSWGEITTKSSYELNNSLTYEVEMEDISGNPEYDAARAIWGGSARIPTSAEIDELVNDCTWEWTKENGVDGMLVTGTNGNSIFLPAAGGRYEKELQYAGQFGSYWGSTPYEDLNLGAYRLDFYANGEHSTWWGYRVLGQTIRPVSD